MATRSKKIRVVELFAGVGGFRIGLDRASTKTRGFETIWNNQWEPSTKKQHASEVYISRFGDRGHSNEDIAKVKTKDIPTHDLLVGGFPCQDYSVARTLSQAAGLSGKKGVLWWEIHRILKEKKKEAPALILLENVDRLIKSPASQRGRDFAIMLASLSDLGYIVEWRVINAADYGMPQRRRRIFILGYKKNSKLEKEARKSNPLHWISKHGISANAFPIESNLQETSIPITLEGGLHELTKEFGWKKENPFQNSGLMIDRKVWTYKVAPIKPKKQIVLEDILLKESDVPQEFFIDKKSLPVWRKLKGGKNEIRETKSGHQYKYAEGPIAFPDPINKPSRTIVTGEGGPTPSRFKHVVETKKGLRRLTPIELERLCMFPDNHTAGQPDTKRAFFMGNALVVGVIERFGKELLTRTL